MKHPRPLGTLRSAAARLAAAAALAALPLAQEEGADAEQGLVGRPAPALSVDGWVNAEPGERPALESLRGAPVLLEFWGTTRKACMKQTPFAQVFHTRYGDVGLRVLALTYDPRDLVERVAREYGLTVTLGLDGDMSSYQVYGVPEVPWACLVDAEGRVLFFGPPDLVEPLIENALGLERDPVVLLGQLADAPQEAAEERALCARLCARLCAKAPRSFDLAAWAAARRASEPTAGDPGGSGAPPAGAVELDAYVAARRRNEPEESARLLDVLAERGARDFDLKRWARGVLARLDPLDAEELERLIGARQYDRALSALLFRAPAPAVMERALQDPAFVSHCAAETSRARALAKKGLLAERWLFAGVEPRSANAFWGDMGIGGAAQGADGQPVASLVLGFERIDANSAGRFVEEELLRFLVASELASGRAPDLARAARRVPKERERLVRSLIARHGDPASQDG